MHRRLRAREWLASSHPDLVGLPTAAELAIAHGATYIADPANRTVLYLCEHFCTACRGYVRRVGGRCFHCEAPYIAEAAE